MKFFYNHTLMKYERNLFHMIKSYERLKKLNKEKTRVPKTVQDTIPVDTIYKDGSFDSVGGHREDSYGLRPCIVLPLNTLVTTVTGFLWLERNYIN